MKQQKVAAFATVVAAFASAGVINASTPPPGPDIGQALAEAPIVDLTCEPGELDLNHATREELVAALKIDPEVAERIIAARQHFELADILIAEGIGEGKLAELVGIATCATPLVLPPPPPPHPCVDDDLIDVQLASRDELESVFAHNLKEGETDPTVERLLSWRWEQPFPTLQHVQVVSGIGPGAFKHVVDEICLTPASFTTTTPNGDPVDYKWLYTDAGGWVESSANPTYRLDVPTGVIDDPTGTWGSITILEASGEYDDWPKADLHLESSFSGEVVVQLPLDEHDHEDPANEPLLWHLVDETTNEWEVFDESTALITPTSISAATTSLSIWESIRVSTVQGLTGTLRWITGTFISAPGCGNVDEIDVDGAPVAAGSPTGAVVKYCETYDLPNGDQGHVTLRNASQVMFEYLDASSDFSQEELTAAATGSLFERLMASIFDVAAPGADITLSVPAEYHELADRLVWAEGFAAVEVDPHELATLINAVLTTWAEPISDMVDGAVENLAAKAPSNLRLQAAAELTDEIDDAIEHGLLDSIDCFIAAVDTVLNTPTDRDGWLAQIRSMATPCVKAAFAAFELAFELAKERAIEFRISPDDAKAAVGNFLSSITRNAVSAERILKSVSAISQYAPIATAMLDYTT